MGLDVGVAARIVLCGQSSQNGCCTGCMALGSFFLVGRSAYNLAAVVRKKQAGFINTTRQYGAVPQNRRDGIAFVIFDIPNPGGGFKIGHLVSFQIRVYRPASYSRRTALPMLTLLSISRPQILTLPEMCLAAS